MRYVAGGFVAAFIALICWLWGPQMLTGFSIFFTSGAFILIPLVAIALLIAAASVPLPALLRGAAGVGAAAVIVLTIIGWVRYDFDVKSIYAAEAEVTSKAAPDFSERAPYDVARVSSSKNLGSTTGEVYGVKSLSDQGEHGIWNALVQRRGWMTGYESLQSTNVPLYGEATSSTVTTCDFDIARAGQRLGGVFPHESLDYTILASTAPNVTFEVGDAYAYCDGDAPTVVVPLKALAGWWTPVWEPAGAAVYNGKTGQLTIHTDTSDIPGPVYPQSLAVAQRESLVAIGSWDDFFFSRSGFEDTAGDEGDPNAGNTSEFTMRLLGENDSEYVTPLTPRGDSTSVVALASTPASTATVGVRNTLVVHEYKEGQSRAANSSIKEVILSQYSFMPDWASGLTIFEIVPGKDGAWVASIGQKQSVVYRAVVDAKGDAVLYDSKGDEVTRTGSSKPSTPGGGAVDLPGAGDDLSDMTAEQLRDIVNAVIDELAARTATE